MESKIVWSTLDNSTGEKSLKQHAFKPHVWKNQFYEEYEGNKSLCSKIGASDDGETYMKIDQIDNEPISPNVCKKCLAISKRL